MSNRHTPLIAPAEDGAEFTNVTCNAPGCRYRCRYMVSTVSRDDFPAIFHRAHGNEYDPGRAPSIEVDWEPSGSCSTCGRGDIETGDDDTVQCDFCGSYWSHDGSGGTEDEERLRELFDEAWHMAHVWMTAGRDADGNIRMESGTRTLVAGRNDKRADVESWLERASHGSRYWMQYRAALDLIDREEAEAARRRAMEHMEAEGRRPTPMTGPDGMFS